MRGLAATGRKKTVMSVYSFGTGSQRMRVYKVAKLDCSDKVLVDFTVEEESSEIYFRHMPRNGNIVSLRDKDGGGHLGQGGPWLRRRDQPVKIGWAVDSGSSCHIRVPYFEQLCAWTRSIIPATLVVGLILAFIRGGANGLAPPPGLHQQKSVPVILTTFSPFCPSLGADLYFRICL
jgi:hypothetical protein